MAQLSRRVVVRSLLGGTALAAAGAYLGTANSARGTTLAPLPDLLPAVNLSPLIFHSPRVRPFIDALPRLPVLTGSTLTVAAAVSSHRFHAELGTSPSFGYAGASYLGPVIEAHSGHPTVLTLRNSLARHVFANDIDTTLEGASATDRTAPRSVLHLHGGANPPASDGHPQATILPQQAFTHTFPNRQEACMLWYHDHAMGITRLNVYAGLAAPYLLRDRWDTGQPGNPLGLPAGEFEIPLVLQEKIFTADGAQSVRSTPVVPQGSWEGGAVGDVGLVNGVAWPYADVARGLYRLRIVNAASFSVWNLFFSNGMPFWVIGTDGGLLDAPVPTTSVQLAPAERIDVLVDFGLVPAGSTVELRNNAPAPGQAAILGEVPMPVFCRFQVTPATGFTGPVPARLRGGTGRPAPLPAPARPQAVRNLTVSQLLEVRIPPAIMVLNNLMFGSADIETPRQGTVEQWNLINTTTDPHPIHVHLVNFRILGRQPFDANAYQQRYPRPAMGTRWTPPADAFVTGPLQPADPTEAGWKDTVRLDGNTITRIIVRFPNAAELQFDPDATFPAPTVGMGTLQGYVWHCHVLDHEDHDMMLRYRVPAA